MICTLFLLLFQQARSKGLYVVERVEVAFSSGERDSLECQYWLSKNRLRTDPEGENLSVIYDLDLHLYYYIDHRSKTYRVTKVSLERLSSRLHLMGLAEFRDGTLQARSMLLESTGKRKKIERWVCEEFLLNMPPQSGVEVRIWSTYHSAMERGFHKKLWYSALGTAPPGDVRHILNEILRTLHGFPIQIQLTVTMEGHQVVTTSTLTDVVEFDEFEDFFSIPAGYNPAPAVEIPTP
jgi:hypothetical protein